MSSWIENFTEESEEAIMSEEEGGPLNFIRRRTIYYRNNKKRIEILQLVVSDTHVKSIAFLEPNPSKVQ